MEMQKLDSDIPIEQQFLGNATDQVIDEAFEKYDVGAKGYLDKDEARRFIAESLGLDNPESTDRDVTLAQFIKNMDTDGCQHISKADMTVFIKK
jgi:Ca2+-binding EF-hand superfamily protein